MLTITPVVLSNNKRRDGSYNVKIRVTWKGRSRYIATNLFCSKSDLTKSLRIKSPAVIDAAASLVRETRESVAHLSPALMEAMDVEDVANAIKSARAVRTFRLDFIEYGQRFALTKGESTRRAYTAALNAFEAFAGRVDVNDITRQLLRDFAKEVEGRNRMAWNKYTHRLEESSVAKLPGGQAARHLAKLAAIYNAARDEFNDEDRDIIVIPRDPFKGARLPIPKSTGGQRNLGLDMIRRIMAADSDDPSVRVALDAFRLSFLLMGANLADLYAARRFDGDVWVYRRRKTEGRRADGAEMRVNIPSEALPIAARFQSRGPWWLGKLHDLTPYEDRVTNSVNRQLKKWQRAEGVEPFTFYAARHSWATIARTLCGVDKATVDECLCHVGDHPLADIYIERDWTAVNEANAKVVALVYKNP